ncbi:hypothetical protein BJF79_22805 [Actinomadura sp. CNU-125]|uniref:hypothetical protein n=1 Tax=Actinomadura sp. CNU-125 TaxID=1904961 RepID=UPI00095E5003|nr:hypothetical protein [Actinomadura sp. CNU-125]OLT12216.1 hypothetical protein BJF79_22805 [Actinomadura sp. CNU-125]
MAKRQLVDLQLTRDGTPVGDRYTSAVDPSDPADKRGLFRDALTRADVAGDGFRIRVWRRGTGEELFVFPAA